MMKKLISLLLAAVTALMLITVQIKPYSAFDSDRGNIADYEPDLYNDGENVFLMGKSSHSLYAKAIAPKANEYTYELDADVRGFCLYSGTIYALTASSIQSNLCFISELAEGKIVNTTPLINLTVGRLADICVDKNGCFYITDSKDKVAIYDSSGKKITTTEAHFYDVISFKDSAYGVNNVGIYKITPESVTKVSDGSGNLFLSKISENFIRDRKGNIYKGAGLTNLLSTEASVKLNAGATKDYIVCAEGGTLYAYDKSTGEKVNSCELSYEPYCLSAVNNKIITVKKSGDKYAAEAKKADKVFTKETEINESGETPEAPGDLNLSAYKRKGKYIYVNRGTTIDSFKKSITCEGFEISFGVRKSGKIPTNLQVSFTRDGISYTYTFVVPGDVTGEGNVNSSDINAVFGHLLNIQKLTGAYKLAADVNKDGKITNIDLVKISKSTG